MTPRLPALWIGLTLAILTVATRLPFASQMLFSFDSANYAFALRDYYNVAHHQPHPPGYPLYVALAKLIDLVASDPNRSLVLLSIAAAALAVSCTYWLGRALFGPRVGLGAAVLLLTSAGFWGYSEVAYPYTALAALSAALALVCWRLGLGAPRLAAASGLLMGAAAGIRWDAVVFLSPLWLLALLRAPWRSRALAALGFVVASLLWAVPMVQLTGGWEAYWAALRAQSGYVVGSFSPFAGGGLVLRMNLETLITYLRQSLGVILLVLAFGLGRAFGPWCLATDGRARFLLLWLLPPLAVYLLVHIGDPGYVLSLAPPACLLAAWTIFDLAAEASAVVVRGRQSTVDSRQPGSLLTVDCQLSTVNLGLPLAAIALIAAWNANVFLQAPGPARLPEIRLIDATLRGQMDYVRTQLQPGRTLVLAHDRFRQTQYYLRGFDVRLLFDEYQPNYRAARARTALPSGLERVVVLDDDLPLQPDLDWAERVIVRTQPEVALWLLDARGRAGLEYGYRHVALLP
ncbi:MAG: DUF2723 domain-containing protein [Chloroflexi bacterium]|nr:DUF2723 domain-containing protein [Chloroflexota bacterium]